MSTQYSVKDLRALGLGPYNDDIFGSELEYCNSDNAVIRSCVHKSHEMSKELRTLKKEKNLSIRQVKKLSSFKELMQLRAYVRGQRSIAKKQRVIEESDCVHKQLFKVEKVVIPIDKVVPVDQDYDELVCGTKNDDDLDIDFVSILGCDEDETNFGVSMNADVVTSNNDESGYETGPDFTMEDILELIGDKP